MENIVTLLLCIKKNHPNVQLPDPIINSIYFYQKNKIDPVTNRQIKMAVNAKLAIHNMSNLYLDWAMTRQISPDQPTWYQFIENKYDKAYRIELWNYLIDCQCCKRHYGNNFRIADCIVGHPTFNGKKRSSVWLSWNFDPPNPIHHNPHSYLNINDFKFHRFRQFCDCPCRHYRRAIEKTLSYDLNIL